MGMTGIGPGRQCCFAVAVQCPDGQHRCHQRLGALS
ncbi:mCG147243 [Mus musculus]|nr:mCG147243 [Mus musculus]